MGDDGSRRQVALDGIALFSALATYRNQVLPLVRKGLRDLEATAAAIPDPLLRRVALSALRDKAANAEATAVFATLAPRPRRPVAVRATLALQAAVDYLDTLGEQPLEDPLASGLTLHGAVVDAVSPPSAPTSNWYSRYPHCEDGGYLASLVTTCREELAALPASGAIYAIAQLAARRCAEGQSHTHAAAAGPSSLLESWALEQPAPLGYAWWELAAGASSSVAIHALIAAAADPGSSTAEAELIDAAYFPPIGALSVLLDDLIDLREDLRSGEHNHMRYYPSNAVAADRLALIAHRARAATEKLRHRHRHAAILAGVAGYYLSAPAARSDYASPIRYRMLEALGSPAKLVAATRRTGRRD